MNIEENISIMTLLISVATSLLASVLFFYFLRLREKKIKSKLTELKSEEEYIEKLSKGNIKLLRSTFIVILIALTCLLFSLLVLFGSMAIELEGKAKHISYYISACLVFIGGIICAYQARSIMWAVDLKNTKVAFQKKRKSLESKLRQNT